MEGFEGVLGSVQKDIIPCGLEERAREIQRDLHRFWIFLRWILYRDDGHDVA